jgi:hypothetical protein
VHAPRVRASCAMSASPTTQTPSDEPGEPPSNCTRKRPLRGASPR